MTPLRKRMTDAMVLCGFATLTRMKHLTAVAQMAQHLKCDPSVLSG